ncbi:MULTISPECIES: 2'-5' RNA ligase family protein [Mumia]|uniref:2'-5' RNA ligase family protein n=1 Tax=Mumia TaxID=1546255 RepID=UPI00141FEC03|nr:MULTISPECIES: 2'-5' RNA ligase family protein [unclassified Mumia]QMW65495.1 2'-5' RNA ligase family protein [Mumia sp. ZJ1417]
MVTFVESEPAPEEFGRDAWPLHVTWVPPFDAAEDDVVGALSGVLAGRPPIDTRAVADTWFGRRREVRVAELARVDEIDALHRAMLAALDDVGVDVRAMRHVGDRFRPHVSEQRGRGVEIGAPVRLEDVSLVAMRPDGDARRRRVVRTWPLGGPATP